MVSDKEYSFEHAIAELEKMAEGTSNRAFIFKQILKREKALYARMEADLKGVTWDLETGKIKR